MVNHSDRVLELLSDGQPHSHLEGYRLGVMLHSRVADLRKLGHVIECWREGAAYVYQLVSLRSPEGDNRLGPASLSGERSEDGDETDSKVNAATGLELSTLLESTSSLTTASGEPASSLPDDGPPGQLSFEIAA